MSQNSPDQEVPLKFDEAKLDSTAVTDEIEYEQKESAESNKDGSDTILFVGGLDEKTTNDQLKFYFEKFGEVEDANIIVDWVTGKSKRCALIFCSTPEVAFRILSQKKHLIQRKKVRVCKADSKKRGTKIIRAKILHLSQIHPSISAQELESYIQTFGAIKKLRLTPLLNPGIFSKSRHGYLELVNEEDCKKLLEHRRCLSINNFKF
jgi:RNA recognition motif-containing protein